MPFRRCDRFEVGGLFTELPRPDSMERQGFVVFVAAVATVELASEALVALIEGASWILMVASDVVTDHAVGNGRGLPAVGVWDIVVTERLVCPGAADGCGILGCADRLLYKVFREGCIRLGRGRNNQFRYPEGESCYAAHLL